MAKVDEIKFWQGTQEQYDNGEQSGNFYDWMNASTLDSVYTDTDTPTTSSTVYSEPFVESSLTITNVNQGLGQAVATTLPSSFYKVSVAYGNGRFVTVANGSNVFVYSTDGINWTQGTMPSSQYWGYVYYINNKFIVLTAAGLYAHSTDGINWTQENLPFSGFSSALTYGDNKYILIRYNSDKYYYSSDGINWTEGTMPSTQNWSSVAYGNGVFVAISGRLDNSNVFAYSTDGINWTQGTLPDSATWYSIAYGNGVFVAVAENNYRVLRSTDGINWEMYGSNTGSKSITFGGGMFFYVSYQKSFSYSKDGISWSYGTLPSIQDWKGVVYGNGKFVAVSDNVDSASNKAAYIPVSNSLTLSDTNSYNRNQAGDEEIKTNVGQDHPDYVCYINEVGIKIADKFIAKKDI